MRPAGFASKKATGAASTAASAAHNMLFVGALLNLYWLSQAHLFRMRPAGLASKKAMGAASTAASSRACMLRAADMPAAAKLKARARVASVLRPAVTTQSCTKMIEYLLMTTRTTTTMIGTGICT